MVLAALGVASSAMDTDIVRAATATDSANAGTLAGGLVTNPAVAPASHEGGAWPTTTPR